jgi:transketolase
MLKATRAGFGDAITKLGQTDPKVVVVSANLASSLKVTEFAKQNPDRFFECGVAENNMMGVAAGLALAGKIPFACSFASFSPYINWATIRQSVCLNHANVKIASSHAGLITGADGATHQALEDLALMQSLPGMMVLVPADYQQAYEATLGATKIKGPVYLRLARLDTELISNFKFQISNKFQIGKAQILKKGSDLTLIACGPIIFEAIKAMEMLNKKASIELINCHTLKPLDKKTILTSVKKTKHCLTIEDHQIFGGLGSAIAQLLSQNYPVPITMMGVNDQFGESARIEEELVRKFCLDAETIKKMILELVKRKS